METIYFLFVVLLASTSVHTLPVFLEPNQFLIPQEQVSVYSPSYIDPNVRLYMVKRQSEPDIGFSDESSENDDSSNGDLQPSHTRYYYSPYVRVRRVYGVRRSQPLHPLSNYADSYDRFPTVA